MNPHFDLHVEKRFQTFQIKLFMTSPCLVAKSSEDMEQTVMFKDLNLCCDFNTEESNPTFLHATPAGANVQSHTVQLQKVQYFITYGANSYF